MLKGICGERDDGLWGTDDTGGMPTGADGLVVASSCTTELWEMLGDGLGSGWHCMYVCVCVCVCLSGRGHQQDVIKR